MGVVYLAHQDSPRRTVALKVIKEGRDNQELRRRFRLEAEVLLRLEHPGIAQIYDVGIFETDSGAEPYLAMELIEGLTLTDYVNKRQLAAREKLALLIQVCHAVHHAHSRGIVHRDLKPGNILVDAAGHCKILDFGLARWMDVDVRITTVRTDVARLLGTIPYMSPEQVAGDAAHVDHRSDIYALGVIAYELLVGRLPYDVAHCSVPLAARRIQETDPTPLSSISPALRGDAETIVNKALEKEPARRYQSAAELAADLQRYLDHRPIAARPTSTIYQMRKFARRNRGLVAGATLALFILIAGTVVSTTLAISRTSALVESERQREIAAAALTESEKQREIAQAVNDFLNKDLLGQANPDLGVNHDVKLREVLDNASRAIDSRLLDKPLINAAVRFTLARSYFNLGVHDEAERHLAIAQPVFLQEYGTVDRMTNDLRHTRVQVALARWKLDEAAAILDETLAVVDRDPPPSLKMAAEAYGDLGILRKKQGKFKESEQAYRKAIEFCLADPSADPFKAHLHKQNLAIVLNNQQKHCEAEQLLHEVVAAYTELTGADSEDTAYALNNLGAIVRKCRPGPEGLQLSREYLERALDIRKRRLGEEHPETLRTIFNMAAILVEQGELIQAEAMQRELLERRLRIEDEDHVDVLDTMFDLAKNLEKQERLTEAAALYRTVLSRGQPRYGPAHFHVNRWGAATVAILNKLNDQQGLHEVFVDYLAALDAKVQKGEVNQAMLATYADTLLDCQIESLRDPVKALQIAELAINTGDKTHAGAQLSYAAALERNGRPDEALAAMHRALALIPESNQKYRSRVEQAIADLRSGQEGKDQAAP